MKIMLRSLVLCTGLLTLLVCNKLSASGFQVSPIRFEYSAQQRVQELRISNRSEQPLVVQVELMQWQQIDGQEKLSPTRDLLASPPIVEVAARQKRAIRIGRRSLEQTACESSYRVIVTEIPARHAKTQEPVKFRSRMRLPLFIENGEDCRAHLQAQRQGQAIVLRNSGNAHTQLQDALVIGPHGQWPLSLPQVGYVLANSMLLVELPDQAQTHTALQLHYRQGRDTLHLPIQ